MIDKDKIPVSLLPLIEAKFRNFEDTVHVPPPSFDAMHGGFIDCDLEEKTFCNRFPVLAEQLNVYGYMQGGFIATAIDNTIGPLSVLVGPPNVTRSLEVKYGKGIHPEIGFIQVTAKFIEQNRRQLMFEAVVEAEGEKLASAKAVHWIVE